MAHATQLNIPLLDAGEQDALHYWADSIGESRGEVFTRIEVVEFILDLTGWQVGHNLIAQRVYAELSAHGLPDACIKTLMDAWLLHADFLTRPFPVPFTHVVGNPPYLRIEALPRPLMQRYRTLFRTMFDRADIYIAFFEKGLSLLASHGKLGYICANRWTKNRYGGPLREMIADSFHMQAYIDFTGVDAFHGEVIAYPAVTVIRHGMGTTTQVVDKEDVHCAALPDLATSLSKNRKDPRIKRMEGIANQSDPWLLSNASRLLVIQELERTLPTLQEAECKVGIGVATGADKAFIGTDEALDVEPQRKLPLLTRKDLINNRIHWKGKHVLNPYAEEGKGLVDLDRFPKFKSYLERHRELIQKRHVARRNPNFWYKTIDRIYPELTAQPKLVIPDIQGEPQVAYDSGQYYPHHNLYYITAREWDLRALQTVLRSRLANAFVATYSLRMRGDCLRFQAQYLRRIRIPHWHDVPKTMRRALADLAESTSQEQIDQTVRKLYGLDATSWQALSTD
ncbi:MAG: Eco57I restriction-modification methylase domain-containing protein [Opitutales bacterium]